MAATAERRATLSALENAGAATQQSAYHLLHADADLLGHRADGDGVVAAACRRVEDDRLAEPNRPLRRQRYHAERTEERKEGSHRQIGNTDELTDRAHAT